MKAVRNTLTVVFLATLFATLDVRGQTAAGTNAGITGPLAGLAQSAVKVGLEEDLPANLCGLLWPDSGAKEQKRTVKKVVMAEKHEGDGRIFCVRPDNHDIVLMRHTETKPDEESKLRREFYFRTTAQGELTLALEATFQFGTDDADNDLLKKSNWQTYGATTSNGIKPLPFTPEITVQFEAEKKFWLGQEKKLEKLAHKSKK